VPICDLLVGEHGRSFFVLLFRRSSNKSLLLVLFMNAIIRRGVCARGLDAHRRMSRGGSSIHPHPWHRFGILVAVCLCATVADAFLSGASLGRIAPVIRADPRSAKSAVTMQFKVPEFKLPSSMRPSSPREEAPHLGPSNDDKLTP